MTSTLGRTLRHAAFALVLASPLAAPGAQFVETEMFRADVAAGKLPAVQKRVPATPLVVRMDEAGMQPGKHFGALLDEAFEAQLEGQFTDLDGALKWLEDRRR